MKQFLQNLLTEYGILDLAIIVLFGYFKIELNNLKERHRELREDCKDWNNLFSGKVIKVVSKNGKIPKDMIA